MSPSRPPVCPVSPDTLPGPGLYQRFGPTLWSVVIHLSAAILLALATVGSGTQGGDELELTTGEELPLFEPEEIAVVELEKQLAQTAAAAATDFAAVPVEEADSPTELAVEAPQWEPAVETLLPNMGGGSEGIGEGRGQGRISMFGLAGEGSKFVYVFDRSSSMTSKFRIEANGRLVSELTPLELAKAELLESLHDLTPDDQFQIVFYNQQPLLFSDNRYLHRLFAASEDLKAEAQQFVAEVPGEGGTNHLGALQMALKLKPEVIFLITDGERKDDLRGSHVRTLVKACQRHNVTVHLIHFGAKPRPNSTLVRLATQTGGMHRFIDVKELAELALAAKR
jgi:hypothetical protein